MYESLDSSEPGANGDEHSSPAGQPSETGDASDRYGDVPLGVESAWPMSVLPVTD